MNMIPPDRPDCHDQETESTSEPAPSTEANTVIWDRPGDEHLTWSRDKIAFPGPLTPLVQSYLPYHTQGWARANRARGTPGATRIRFVSGYYYSTWEPVGLTTWEEAEAAGREAERVTPNRWEREWLPEIRVELERLRAFDLSALADDELSRVLQEALTKQIRIWGIHAHMGSSPIGAVQRLVNWYLDRFPGAPESEPYKLVQGQRNASVESGHHLWQLSRMVTPAIAGALQSGEWEQLPEPFRQAFEAYLDQFGHRTQALVDPGSPTWREDPRPVARLILSYAENDVSDPYLGVERLAADREAFTAEVRAKLAPHDREEFDRLLACALANYPLTEDHTFWLEQQSVAAIRRICAEFGRRMAAAGALDSPEDISYLTLGELTLWGLGLADPLGPRVAKRKAQHEANGQITPPDFLGVPPQPATWIDRYTGPSSPRKAEAGEIRGVGASMGVARGPARVVRTLDLNEAQSLRQGEVLVCVATYPNWTPLFGLAAALVTDTGGSLCHAATLAREYRLPAVVGTHTATKIIKNGQIVEVDGAKGLVRLL